MNIVVETHLNIEDLEDRPDLAAQVVADFCKVITNLGLGNKLTDDGRIDCIIVIKSPENEDNKTYLKKIVKGAWAITFPTKDKAFMEETAKNGFDIEVG